MGQKKISHTSMHGVLIDVLGVGVLLVGKSGMGKSECALDLVMRGHRLVADDLIRIEKGRDGSVSCFGPDLGRHHMEIRGLGLINIEKLFGITATKHREQIELVIELVTPEECTDDRVGLKDETYTILDVAVPYKRVPVSSGRNLTPIVEVAARDYLLKRSGYHAAKEFEEELLMNLKKRESNEK